MTCIPRSAARKAAAEVRKGGLGRLVDSETFYVEDMAGPLAEGELDRARSWGAELATVMALEATWPGIVSALRCAMVRPPD